MLRRMTVAAVWSTTLAGAILLLAAGGFVFRSLFGTAGFALVFIGLALDVVVFASVGAILAFRRPGNVVGGVLMAGGLLIVLTFLGFILGAALTTVRGVDDPLAGLVSLLGALGIDPALIVAGPLLALLFPDGRLPGPRWRWPAGAIFAALAIGSILIVLRAGPVGDSLGTNPFGVTGVPWLEAVAPVGETLHATALVAALLLALAAVVVRFRRSRDTEREQLKWFVGANLLVVLFLFLSLADGATDPTPFDLLAVCSLSLPPIAVGIAILRYRLYEIDRLISRTIGWTIVTGVLVAVFAGAVIALQAALSGITQGQTLAVAGSTLVAFALFQPVRRRIQSAVDRRFDRSRYDGERTAAAFAERVRDEMDLARLGSALVATADDAVRPTSAGVWLRVGPEVRR